MVGTFLSRHTETLACKDIGYWRELVVGLGSGYMVNVGGIGQIRGLIGDVPGNRMWLVSTSKSLVERGGLNHALVSKLFV